MKDIGYEFRRLYYWLAYLKDKQGTSVSDENNPYTLPQRIKKLIADLNSQISVVSVDRISNLFPVSSVTTDRMLELVN